MKIAPIGKRWMVRADDGGSFGPVGVSREEAQEWAGDPVRVAVVEILKNHTVDFTRYGRTGNHLCTCGADVTSWDCHYADVIADGLRLAGLIQ